MNTYVFLVGDIKTNFKRYRPGIAWISSYFFIRSIFAPVSRFVYSHPPKSPKLAIHHWKFMGVDTTGKLQEWRGDLSLLGKTRVEK